MNNKIDEDFVGFEIAKLLKEKNYAVDTVHYFIDVNGKNSNHKSMSSEHFLGANWNHYPSQENSSRVSCPTHSLAIKWIRENFNYNVEVTYRNADKNYQAISHPIFPNTEIGLCGHYKSPKEATEAALLYTLQNLIP